MSVLMSPGGRFVRIHFHFDMAFHAGPVVDHHPWGTDITHHIAAIHNLHLLLYGDIADHAPGNVQVKEKLGIS